MGDDPVGSFQTCGDESPGLHVRSPQSPQGGLALVALSGPRTREPAGLLFVLPFKNHCSVKHSARPGRREAYTVMRRDAAEMRGTRAENRDARTERRPRDARVRVRETGNQRYRSTGGRVGRASRSIAVWYRVGRRRYRVRSARGVARAPRRAALIRTARPTRSENVEPENGRS